MVENVQMLHKQSIAVFQHCDDADWGTGGEIARTISLGGNVDQVLLTDSNFEGNGLIREAEELRAMAFLGMGRLFPYGRLRGFKDFDLKAKPINELEMAVSDAIDEGAKFHGPYTRMITWGWRGYTGHPDHIIGTVAAYMAFLKAPSITELWMLDMGPEERALWPKDYFVPIPEVDVSNHLAIDITKYLGIKAQALMFYKTQYAHGIFEHIARLSQIKLPREYFQIIKKSSLINQPLVI